MVAMIVSSHPGRFMLWFRWWFPLDTYFLLTKTQQESVEKGQGKQTWLLCFSLLLAGGPIISHHVCISYGETVDIAHMSCILYYGNSTSTINSRYKFNHLNWVLPKFHWILRLILVISVKAWFIGGMITKQYQAITMVDHPRSMPES